MVDEFESKFNAQEEIYLELLKENVLEEQTQIDKMVAEFNRSRSAKLIQRWWRSIRRSKRRKSTYFTLRSLLKSSEN